MAIYILSFVFLVGGWTNPFEKYARQIGSFPQAVGGKIKNIWVATTQFFYISTPGRDSQLLEGIPITTPTFRSSKGACESPWDYCNLITQNNACIWIIYLHVADLHGKCR